MTTDPLEQTETMLRKRIAELDAGRDKTLTRTGLIPLNEITLEDFDFED